MPSFQRWGNWDSESGSDSTKSSHHLISCGIWLKYKNIVFYCGVISIPPCALQWRYNDNKIRSSSWTLRGKGRRMECMHLQPCVNSITFATTAKPITSLQRKCLWHGWVYKNGSTTGSHFALTSRVEQEWFWNPLTSSPRFLVHFHMGKCDTMNQAPQRQKVSN